MTKVHYLTARCPQGCEAWLHPLAVEPHLLDPKRCRRRPWVDDLPDVALVGAPLAQDIADVLPSDLLSPPSFSGDRILSPDPDNYIPIHLCQGVVVRSPVPGIRAQRWAVVASAAAREHGAPAIDVATTLAGFSDLERQLTAKGRLTQCPICGDTTTVRGLRNHQARNRACRWRVVAAEVRALWTYGWRDPYSVDGAPLKWGELTATVRWRKRAHIVRFPAWSAVLLAPDAASDLPCRGEPEGRSHG
jgi:hypothetical protein